MQSQRRFLCPKKPLTVSLQQMYGSRGVFCSLPYNLFLLDLVEKKRATTKNQDTKFTSADPVQSIQEDEDVQYIMELYISAFTNQNSELAKITTNFNQNLGRSQNFTFFSTCSAFQLLLLFSIAHTDIRKLNDYRILLSNDLLYHQEAVLASMGIQGHDLGQCGVQTTTTYGNIWLISCKLVE